MKPETYNTIMNLLFLILITMNYVIFAILSYNSAVKKNDPAMLSALVHLCTVEFICLSVISTLILIGYGLMRFFSLKISKHSR